jgi:hypothetical protein
MKERIHTSRKDRDLTVDGLSKHHNEPMAMKVRAAAETVKITEGAAIAKLSHNTIV